MDKVKYIVMSLGGLVIVYGILAFFGIAPGLRQQQGQKIVLSFWGVTREDQITPLLIEFSAQHPSIEVEYTQLEAATYEKRLLEAFATQQGPDLFEIENTWLPRYLNKITPAPSSVISARDVRQTLVDGAVQDFVKDEEVYGLPYYIDTLGLFYNDAILKSAGFSFPPRNWDEFIAVTKAITRKNTFGEIDISAAALGTEDTVRHAPDIIALLMMQAGLGIVDETRKAATFNEPLRRGTESIDAGARALEFYTSFATPGKENYTWSSKFPGSLESFGEFKTAMMVDYPSAIDELRAKYPQFSFKTALFPQPKNAIVKVAFARYWVPVVWAYSPYPTEAWMFSKFLIDPALNDAYTKTLGKPSTLLSLVESHRATSPENVVPFVDQVLIARNFYQIDNFEIEKIFRTMIERVRRGDVGFGEAIESAARNITARMQGENQ